MDNTLCKPRKEIKDDIKKELLRLLEYYEIGIITGSGIKYIEEQIDFVHKNLIFYPCNGTQCFKLNNLGVLKEKYNYSMKEVIKDYNKVLEILDFYLELMFQELDFDFVIDGDVLQERESMINICPIGRGSKKLKREKFIEFDKKHGFREKWLNELRKTLNEYGVDVVLGGQTSFDVFPFGWDKSFVIDVIDEPILFFGDAIKPNGNDYCMLRPEKKVICVSVNNPDDTLNFLKKIKTPV